MAAIAVCNVVACTALYRAHFIYASEMCMLQCSVAHSLHAPSACEDVRVCTYCCMHAWLQRYVCMYTLSSLHCDDDDSDDSDDGDDDVECRVM